MCVQGVVCSGTKTPFKSYLSDAQSTLGEFPKCEAIKISFAAM